MLNKSHPFLQQMQKSNPSTKNESPNIPCKECGRRTCACLDTSRAARELRRWDLKFKFNFVRICFGLFAIRRTDATNDAIFDPDGILRLRWNAQVIERKSWVSDKKTTVCCFFEAKETKQGVSRATDLRRRQLTTMRLDGQTIPS